MTLPALTIDVISDVVCPWCFLGQRRLDKAVAANPDIDIDVRWRPYQLDPDIPPQGLDRRQYMLAKFGNDERRLKEIHDRLVSLGAIEGIDFHFEDIRVAVNTIDAHRLIRWAASAGGSVQHAIAKALFSANFEKGENISDPEVLARIAGENGMDEAVARSLLASDADREEVRAEIAQAQRMGVTGVPCFLLDGKYAVMGAQDVDVLADAIRQVAAKRQEEA